MNQIEFQQASDHHSLCIIESLANKIWYECYTSITGKDSVDYMLEKFQSKKALEQQLKDGYSYYLLKNKDDYIGYVGVQPKDTHLFLSKIYIQSEHRRCGFGKQAIKFIESIAKTNNCPKISLTVNKDNINAINSYKRFGFNIVDSFVTDIGGGYVMDDYGMEKLVR